jgi:hypothetical protein
VDQKDKVDSLPFVIRDDLCDIFVAHREFRVEFDDRRIGLEGVLGQVIDALLRNPAWSVR